MTYFEFQQSLGIFERAYLEAAFWASSMGDDGESADDLQLTWEDIGESEFEKILGDCRNFQDIHGLLIDKDNLVYTSKYSADERAGHDFWLTRNGHGAGFWDGDWKEPAATKMTEGSRVFGELWLYIGDDGKIHGF